VACLRILELDLLGLKGGGTNDYLDATVRPIVAQGCDIVSLSALAHAQLTLGLVGVVQLQPPQLPGQVLLAE
jgi:hypothetical protein